jgi:hypothetical protein
VTRQQADNAQPRACAALGQGPNRESAERFAANILPVIRQIQASGVSSLRGVAWALSARGIATARQCDWVGVSGDGAPRRSMSFFFSNSSRVGAWFRLMALGISRGKFLFL